MKKPRFITSVPIERLAALPKRRRLTFLAALLLLSVAASALFMVRGRAAAATSPNPTTAQRSLPTAHSLSWLSDSDWKNPRAYANGSDVFSIVFAGTTAPEAFVA
jgi:hypothetical protein